MHLNEVKIKQPANTLGFPIPTTQSVNIPSYLTFSLVPYEERNR